MDYPKNGFAQDKVEISGVRDGRGLTLEGQHVLVIEDYIEDFKITCSDETPKRRLCKDII